MTLSDRYVHEIPFPIAVRAVLFVVGAVACFLTIWELGRALWPPNLFSPFFAIIIGGGCFVGGAFMFGAITGPAVVMTFSPGELAVTKTWPWGASSERHAASAIEAMRVEMDTSSDGPNEWFVEIRLHSGARLPSRRFGSLAAAEAEMKAFAAALSEADDATSTDRA